MKNVKPLPWSETFEFGLSFISVFLGLAVALSLCPQDEYSEFSSSLMTPKGRKRGHSLLSRLRLHTPFGVVQMVFDRRVDLAGKVKATHPEEKVPTWVRATDAASKRTLSRIIQSYFGVDASCDNAELRFYWAYVAVMMATCRRAGRPAPGTRSHH